MAFRGEHIDFGPLNRGLYSTLGLDLPENATPDTRNSRFHPNYTEKRRGMAQVGGVVKASTRIFGGHQFRQAGTLKDCCAAADGKFYVNVSGTWTDRTGAVTITTTADKRVRFSVFNDVVIGTDDTNTPFSWDGNTGNNAAVLTGSPPQRAKFMEPFGNYLVAFNFRDSGGTERRNGIAWSAIDNPNSWTTTTTGRMLVQERGSQEILGVGQRSGRLVFYFEDAVYELVQTGNDLFPFQFSLLLPGHGTRASQAVVSLPNDVYAMGPSGPWSLEQELAGGQTPRIKEALRDIWSGVDYADAATFCGFYSEKESGVRFSVRDGTAAENNLTLLYRPDFDTWTADTGYVADVGWPYINSSGVKTVAAAGTDRVFELDTGTQDLSPTTGAVANISWYIWTPHLDCRQMAGCGPSTYKQWFTLFMRYLQSTQNSMSVGYQLALFPGLRTTESIALINQTDVGLWDSAIWDASLWGSDDDDQAQGRLELEGESTHIRFKFATTSAYPVAFEGFTVFFKNRSYL